MQKAPFMAGDSDAVEEARREMGCHGGLGTGSPTLADIADTSLRFFVDGVAVGTGVSASSI